MYYRKKPNGFNNKMGKLFLMQDTQIRIANVSKITIFTPNLFSNKV